MERDDVLKNFLTVIGENITKHRKQKKMTLEALGLEIGLTRMQVHRIEKGYNITLSTLLKLSLALEVLTQELVIYNPKKLGKTDLEELVNNNKSTKIKKSKSGLKLKKLTPKKRVK